MTTLAETILRDVPRYWQASNRSLQPATDGEWLSRADVLAALTAALDGVDERAGEVLSRLRKADEYEPLGHDGWEAADLITALLAQNAVLRAERDVSNELGRAFEQDAGQQRALAEAAEAQIAALTARVEGLTGALSKLHHAVCGETGFAACVRLVSGKAYPWPALDDADETARAALSTTEEGHE